MNQVITRLLLSIGILAMVSCGHSNPNEQIDEGAVEGNTYTSDEIGWTMEIPKGWKVVDKDKTEAREQRGYEALQEVVDGEIDFTGLKHLISFQKNDFNIFQSTSEPFDTETDWSENHNALKEIIYVTYSSQGIRADSSVTTIETIDGLDFLTYSFSLYNPNGKIIMTQIMYSRLINGYDFGININFNNEKDKEEMLHAWKNSKFRKE